MLRYHLHAHKKILNLICNDAGTADDKTRATIQSVTVTPDTPKKGEDLTIMATFTLSKAAKVNKLIFIIRLLSGDIMHLYG